MRITPEGREDQLRTEVLLVLLAIGAGIMENFIPRPVPFLKPGLANIVTVVAIVRYGFWTGIRINVLRSAGTAVFLGTLATPTFILSLAGGIVSASVMGSFRSLLSVTGMSIAGSISSLFMQLLLASVILPGLPTEVLVMTIAFWGFLSGTFTGILAAVLLRKGFPWALNTGVDSPSLPE